MKNTTLSLNQLLLKSALQAIKLIQAKYLFVYADALNANDYQFPLTLPKSASLVLFSQENVTEAESKHLHVKRVIKIPDIKLGRIGLIKMTIAIAISQQLVQQGDKVVFLSGLKDPQQLDQLLVMEVGREAEIITYQNFSNLSSSLQPEVFEQVLSLAVELANKGREGKPVGTIFVVGDQERVMQLSKQMIINPFKGYDESERNILNPQLKETLREFSAIDGAFVIADDGTVVTAGRYLGAAHDSEDVPRGLGSRHLAAAGITALTNAIALVISESTGDLRIFKNGKILMEIEKT